MKPREIINKRRKTYLAIVAAGFLAMVIVAYAHKFLPGSLYEILSDGSVTVFVVGVILIYAGIRCPKCKTILGLKYVYSEETLKKCPRCGIVFDEDTM